MKSQNSILTQNNRSVDIDVLKGIGIITVVLGHLTSDNQMLRVLIYSFHMPLFFFISGVLSGNKENKKSYIFKQFKSLYLPYFVFCFLDLCLNALIKGNLLKNLAALLLNLSGIRFSCVNSPIWFLFVLFLIKCLNVFICKNKMLQRIVCVCSMVFVCFCAYSGASFFHHNLYLIACSSILFFLIGDLVREKIKSVSFSLKKSEIIVAAMLVLAAPIMVLTLGYNSCVSVYDMKFADPLLYISESALGISASIVIVSLIKDVHIFVSVLSYFGKNSVWVLVYHIYFTRHIIPLLFSYVKIDRYLYNPFVELILLFIVMGIMFVFIEFSNRYLYFIIGKKKRFNPYYEKKLV